jgi:hypothetical protein
LRRNVKRKKNDVVVVNFGNLMRETVVSNVGRGRVSSHQRNPAHAVSLVSSHVLLQSAVFNRPTADYRGRFGHNIDNTREAFRYRAPLYISRERAYIAVKFPPY